MFRFQELWEGALNQEKKRKERLLSTIGKKAQIEKRTNFCLMNWKLLTKRLEVTFTEKGEYFK